MLKEARVPGCLECCLQKEEAPRVGQESAVPCMVTQHRAVTAPLLKINIAEEGTSSTPCCPPFASASVFDTILCMRSERGLGTGHLNFKKGSYVSHLPARGRTAPGARFAPCTAVMTSE